MIRYPTHLQFDQSGTAIARFFGNRLAGVEMHWIKGIGRNFSVCPLSVGLLGKKCRACMDGQTGIARTVALCWDVARDRWCHLIGHRLLMAKIYNLSISEVGNIEMFSNGHGPDIIIQRKGTTAQVRSIPETCVLSRGVGDLPEIEDFLRGLESRSIWVV
jgi:hypothetical protein